MQTPKNLADRAEKSMGLIRAVFVRGANAKRQDTAQCGTVDGTIAVTVDTTVTGLMAQLRDESPECKTFRELFDQIDRQRRWGTPC